MIPTSKIAVMIPTNKYMNAISACATILEVGRAFLRRKSVDIISAGIPKGAIKKAGSHASSFSGPEQEGIGQWTCLKVIDKINNSANN
jgi:hypothetical protein